RGTIIIGENGNILGQGANGIFASTHSIGGGSGGDITIFDNLDITGTGTGNGITASAYSENGAAGDSGGTIVISGNGDITGSPGTITGWGIYADSYSETGAGGDVTIQGNGNITGHDTFGAADEGGIHVDATAASTYAGGNILIGGAGPGEGNGDITGDGDAL